MPTAFDDILRSGKDILCCFNHDPNIVLGRLSAGDLEISKEQRGLRYRVAYDETDPDHQRCLAKINRKNITGSSFGFTVPKDGQEFRYEDGKLIRELHSVNLAEVSPVYNPAYGNSTCAIRSEDGLTELLFAIKMWKTQQLINRINK